MPVAKIAEVTFTSDEALDDEVTWGIDLADGGAALAIAILLNHDQAVHYISGRAIHRASESYRGGKPTPRTPR